MTLNIIDGNASHQKIFKGLLGACEFEATKDPELQDDFKCQIATVAAQIGCIKEAKDTIGHFSDNSYQKDFALRVIAEEECKQGNLQEAKETVQLIHGLEQKDDVLAIIALSELKRGNIEEAKVIISLMQGGKYKAVKKIVLTEAKAGNFDEAKRIAALVGRNDHHLDLLILIETQEGKSPFFNVLKNKKSKSKDDSQEYDAYNLPKDEYKAKFIILNQMVAVRIGNGDFEGAREIIQMHWSAYEKGLLLLKVIVAEGTGDFGQVKELVLLLGNESSYKKQKDEILGKIISEEMKLGKLIEAVNTIKLINDSYQKDSVLKEVITKVLSLGDISLAKVLAGMITDKNNQVECLCEIAIVEGKKDFSSASSTARSIPNQICQTRIAEHDYTGPEYESTYNRDSANQYITLAQARAGNIDIDFWRYESNNYILNEVAVIAAKIGNVEQVKGILKLLLDKNYDITLTVEEIIDVYSKDGKFKKSLIFLDHFRNSVDDKYIPLLLNITASLHKRLSEGKVLSTEEKQFLNSFTKANAVVAKASKKLTEMFV